MKVKHIFKTIGRVLLISLGFFLLLIALLGALVSHPADRRIVRSAVVLDEPVILPENEGKTVIIQGKLDGLPHVTDSLFGVTIHAPFAKRLCEEYDYDRSGRHGHWDWEDRKTAFFHQPLSVGEFLLTDEIAACIPTPVSLSKAQLGAGLPEGMYIFTEDGHTYFSEQDAEGLGYSIVSHGREGTLRYSYRLPAEGESYTILGIQREGKLYLHESIDEASVQTAADGIDGMIADLRGDTVFGVVFCVIVAAPCLFFGFKGVLYLKPGWRQKRRKASK